MLAAAGLAAISPVSIIPYSIYPMTLGICGIIAILIGFPKFKKSWKLKKIKNNMLN